MAQKRNMRNASSPLVFRIDKFSFCANISKNNSIYKKFTNEGKILENQNFKMLKKFYSGRISQIFQKFSNDKVKKLTQAKRG